MKRTILCAFCLALVVVPASAAESRQDSLKELSQDLAGLQLVIEQAKTRQDDMRFLSSISGGTVAVTAPNTFLHAGAGENTTQLTKAKIGEKFRIIDKAGEWYAVGLEKPYKGVDSAWVKARDVVPAFRPVSSPSSTENMTEVIFNTINEQVNRLRDKYKSNPYFIIKGFSVSLGTNISVSVAFEFKQ